MWANGRYCCRSIEGTFSFLHRFDTRQIGPRLPTPAGTPCAPASQARPDLPTKAPNPTHPVLRLAPCSHVSLVQGRSPVLFGLSQQGLVGRHVVRRWIAEWLGKKCMPIASRWARESIALTSHPFFVIVTGARCAATRNWPDSFFAF